MHLTFDSCIVSHLLKNKVHHILAQPDDSYKPGPGASEPNMG